tara:strand:- start:16767 stop:17348 length:582 start_codon:yes stop_codon:yes gene_type:complete
MSNLFDSNEYPEREPLAFIAGDRWSWKRLDLAPYSSGYALTYSARREADGGEEITITASISGTDFIVEIPSATTAAYPPGVYHWQAYITRASDSQRITIDSGTFDVSPNRDLATSDPRSHNKKVLDSIMAVIEKRATKDQESYSLNGRSLTRTSVEELQRLKNNYQAMYNAEVRRERIKNGLGHSGKIKTRFV